MKNRKCFFCKSTFLKHNDFIRVDNYKIFKCKNVIPHLLFLNLVLIISKKLYSNKNYRNKSMQGLIFFLNTFLIFSNI